MGIFINKIWLIGLGYNQSVESDILLLDISNNENYIWTTTYEPITPSPPSLSSPRSPNKLAIIIGIIHGWEYF